MQSYQTTNQINKTEIVTLSNGSRMQVESRSKDGKFLCGYAIDSNPVVQLYVPVSYIAGPKRKGPPAPLEVVFIKNQSVVRNNKVSF